VFDRLRHVLLPHDWLTFGLTGELVTDRGDASGTGYWSPERGAYSSAALGLIGLTDDVTPAVLGPTTPAGSWHGAVVGPGTGDNMAAALGLGLRPGDLALSLGTSGTAFAVSDRPSEDPTGAVAGFADATGRYLPLACTLNATKVTDTVARLIGADTARFDALALAGRPGADGVVLVPHLDGERTPNRPAATGTLRGLRSDTSPEQIARAAVEGVVCNLLEAADALASGESLAGGRVFLIGGGARSAAYRRVVADLTGRRVVVPTTDELVACGAAVQAAAVLHECSFDDLAASWALGAGHTVEPDLTVDRVGIREAYAEARGEG
jgi:xylulokinase